MKAFLDKLVKLGRKMRQISIILEGLDGQIHSTLENISKYFINFDFLMVFAIIDIIEHFMYKDVEKSRVLFFSKILSNKHAAPPIFNFLKQSVRCEIQSKDLSNSEKKKEMRICFCRLAKNLLNIAIKYYTIKAK